MTGVLHLFSQPVAPRHGWQVGDRVLHKRDAKNREMLLLVMGQHGPRHLRCRYIYNGYAGNKDARKCPATMGAIQIIAVHHLLDAVQFGIKPTQAEQVFCDKLIVDAQSCAAQSQDTHA